MILLILMLEDISVNYSIFKIFRTFVRISLKNHSFKQIMTYFPPITGFPGGSRVVALANMQLFHVQICGPLSTPLQGDPVLSQHIF